jgi:DeoR/GlpR family transcriptional regulator of sugar metabolism
MEERLSKKERQELILGQLRNNLSVRISSLAEQFGVTTETIRRDIDELTERGVVNRTYGGAAAISLAAEPGVLQREQNNVAERTRIARLAVSLIKPDDVLMIDCGSTTNHFAQALATQRLSLTILTNSIRVAQSLSSNPGFRILLCPGVYDNSEHGVYGQEATNFLKQYHANKAIIGAGGIAGSGITDAHSPACWVKRTMIEQAEDAVLLIDRSKFGLRLFEKVCPLASIDDVVADAPPPRSVVQALSAAKVRRHIADTKSR